MHRAFAFFLVIVAAGCGSQLPTPPTPTPAPSPSPTPQPITLSILKVSPHDGWPFYYTEILGTGFQNGARVTFGNTSSVFADVLGAGKLTTIPPWQDHGTVDLTVTNPDGSSVTLAGGFTYKAAQLALSKSDVGPGETITVSWSGPDDPSDFSPPDTVGVYAKNDPTNTALWIEWSPVGEHFSRDVRAPSQPGDYEVRYLMMSHYLLASVPLRVR